MLRIAERLLRAIQNVGIPITDISIGSIGQSKTIEVSPPSLQSSAQPTIDTFDWSEAAQQTWEAAQQAEQAKLLFNEKSPNGQLIRAAVLTALEELGKANPDLRVPDEATLTVAIHTKLDASA